MVTQVNNRDEILSVFEQSKLLKMDIIYIQGGFLYGTNLDYTIIEVYKLDKYYQMEFCFLFKDMKTFVKYIEENPYEDMFISDGCLKYGSMSLNIYNSFSIWKIKWLLDTQFIPNISESKLLMEVKDLYNYFDEDNPYMKKTSEKSVVKFDHNIAIIYGKILPVNKSDKVSLYIYKKDDNVSIYRYIIDKKKKGIIESYMACLNLD